VDIHGQTPTFRRVLTTTVVAASLALGLPTAASAHEGWLDSAAGSSASEAAHDDHDGIDYKSAPAQPAAKVGKACKQKGQISGNLVCRKVKGRLKWVRGTSAVAASSSATDLLCRNATYTGQVKDLRCTTSSVTFTSNGLPSASTPSMVGITATNQQYPTAHDYLFSFPRTPVRAASPSVPGSGAIGVAVDGVPLFSPWTQAAVLQHTLDAGELDECGGHAGRGDDYHYHIAPKCLIEEMGADKVEVKRTPIGIANDASPILALGWFDPANSVESKLDACRGMTDAKGQYFYNVQSTSKWDILDCFTGKVFNTSKDSFTTRRDSAGNEITGAKLALTITESYSKVTGGQTCYVMSGNLRNQMVIQTNQSVVSKSGPAAIFYCSSQCYAEFFEPTAAFPGQSVYLEKVTQRCPAGFNPNSLPLLPAYAGPDIGKRGPGSGPSSAPAAR